MTPYRTHLTEEQLIKYLDGELGKRDRAGAERHVESCWGCRRKLEQFRQAIDRFAEFDTVLAENVAVLPPNDWSGFTRGLRGIADSSKMQPAPVLTMRRAAVLTPAVCASVLIAAPWLAPATTMSAKEVYERSTASEQALLSRTGNPLVIQQVRVESAQRTAIWSLWRAPSMGRNHQSWNDSHLQAEVERLFAGHGLDFSQPLSVANHSKWRRSLAKGEDVVRRDGEFLRVRTRSQEQPGAGQIVEAQLVVRASDWHPVEESFTVTDASGERQYRLVEASYRVESISAESALIFEAPVLVIDRAPELIERAPDVPDTPGVPVRLVPPPPALGPVETEIEALALIHEMGADRRESARVDREGSVVRVTGYAADAERKALLENSLSGFPGLKVSIALLSAQPASQASESVPLKLAPPAQPLFLQILKQRTGSLAAANSLVSAQMNLLWELSVESGAVADLARRFSETAMTPSSRQDLDSLALDHLAAAGQVWVALSESSSDLLAAIGVPAASAAPASHECGDWRSRGLSSAAAARRLADLYARSFTLSASAQADQISEESVRNEVPALRAELAQAFPEGCRKLGN